MHRTLFLLLGIIVTVSSLSAQQVVVPSIITNHYGTSEPESHGLVTIDKKNESLTVSVNDLSRDQEYQVVLLNEMTGERKQIGTLKTDRKGTSSSEFDATGLLKAFNAMLLMNDEDVIQYTQLQESHHGCICRHSGGTIVTQRLDQDCFECPCGVKYEICCGGQKKH